ncbi:hypothetical protein [Kitasatospora sp. NPDC050543]|uniref:hypothetical protein n=1 Tax=Kitasatospora sp. NPDC050543 TaxID=3364054 RepID=UPI00379701F9
MGTASASTTTPCRVATTLELLAEHGPLGPVWWRYGRAGRHGLLEALENPNNRAAYDQRQKAREKKARQEHRDLMRALACADCGNVPEQASSGEYDPQGRMEWTRRPGGLCWACHEKHQRRRQEGGRPRPRPGWRQPARPTPRCARAGRAGARSAGRPARSWS